MWYNEWHKDTGKVDDKMYIKLELNRDKHHVFMAIELKKDDIDSWINIQDETSPV